MKPSPPQRQLEPWPQPPGMLGAPILFGMRMQRTALLQLLAS